MVTLNNLFESYSVRPLDEGETIQSFNCGDTELNDFIINKAAKYRDELLAVSYVLEENDTSALGAAMVAAIGEGWFDSWKDAVANVCRIKEQIEPVGTYKAWLEERYSIYKKMYPAVKEQYKELRRISQ